MGRLKGSKNKNPSKADRDKDPYSGIPEEWVAKVRGTMDINELTKIVKETAVNDVVLRMAKKHDAELNEILEKKKTAETQYVEGAKLNKKKLEALVTRLTELGAEVPSIQDFIRNIQGMEEDAVTASIHMFTT